jgi:glucoamylase
MQRGLFILLLALNCTALFGQATNHTAPGAPGGDAHWPTAAKNGFGTANSLSSKVWFTLAEGVLTEVFYPTLDVPNVQTLQLLVVSDGKVETERDDMFHQLEVSNSYSPSFRQVNKSHNNSYSIRKSYVIDPSANVVLIDVVYQSQKPADVYIYFDPSLNNSGRHDTAWINDNSLLASDGDIASALISDCGFESDQMTAGFLFASDGLTQLRKERKLTRYDRANDGNVVQVAKLKKLSGQAKANVRCTLALGFGTDSDKAFNEAHKSLKKGFVSAKTRYEREWRNYVARLPRVNPKYQAQLNMCAMVLRALEDKTYRGAMIASPSSPWGGGPNANDATTTGYHAVWSRDLYHVATAFLQLGDKASASRALDYLFRVQQKPDGSFPQNTHVDGQQIGGALQMDQIAYPLILAYQINRTDQQTWRLHLKPAADFIAQHGPVTEQERWEEERGFSPASIAAQIAGLVCAANAARINHDSKSARLYLSKAEEWSRKVEMWTATSTGRFGTYYLRIAQNGNPNEGATLNINSGGGDHDEREIVDASFLELVRLGIKRADDPLILKSLKVVDQVIKVQTSVGPAWYRYNGDAYGERHDGGAYDGRSGKGRPWPLLTGERGEYELARGNRVLAQSHLDGLMAFANDGRMLPEQIWDQKTSQHPGLRSGAGTGSATPLGWAMAQFIRLTINLQRGRNLETPQVVVKRLQAPRQQ